MSLEKLVLSVVKDFVSNNVLFTALDVSNTVKNTLPFARHHEVRDLVRSVFSSEIEVAGYARTPIMVTIANGSNVEALLYHPLVDSWDLDAKYDNQKRSQSTSHASKPAPVPVGPVSNIDVWSGLFKSQPSLFPSK